MPSFICGSGAVSTSTTARPHRRRPRSRRILLLGIGGAGKSTLFRQIRGAPVSYKEVQSLKVTIHNMVVTAIKALVDGALQLGRTHPSLGTNLTDDSALERSLKYVMDELVCDHELLPKAGRHIARLWLHPAVRRTFQLRLHFGLHIPDSAPYFFDRINTVTALGYVPNSSDYMHCTVKSSGISDTITDDGLQILDLGGRRMERRKWMRCFDSVAGVIYVASVGDFMDPLEEDPSVNRLVEALAVFEEIVNHRLCQGLPIVVAFTKVDLLPETFRRCRLADLFPDYSGGSDPQKALAFFKTLFLSKVRSPSGAARPISFQVCQTLEKSSAMSVVGQLRETLRLADSLVTTAQPHRL